MAATPTPTRAVPVPFWNRLRQIALYPLRGSVAIMLSILTVGSLLGYLPGIGMIVTLVLWFSAYKFAFEILRSSADGDDEPPENLLSVDNGTVWRFLALQLVLMVLVVFAFAGGPLVGFGTMLLVAFLQPGMIMSLAVDGSFGRAIDPSTSLAIVGRIGGPYFAAFGLLFVIQVSAATGGNWLEQFLPAVVGQLGASLFGFWGLFATFHLMGYLVYQYHDELGYSPASHERALPTLHSRDHELNQRAEALVRDGRADEARHLLREEIRTRAVTSDTHDLYRRLLRQTGDATALEQHAALYLNLLMVEKQERKALALLREALDANPDFVPMQQEHAELLARRAQGQGQAQLAIDQWLALLRRHPRDASAPRWAFDASLLLVERYGRDAEARRLLDQARSRSEDPELTAKIDALLRSLPAT